MMMTARYDLTPFEWPRARLSDALRALSDAARFETHAAPPAASDGRPGARRDDFVETLVDAAGEMGLDVEATDVPAARPLVTLRDAAPLLLGLRDRQAVLAVLRVGARTTTLVGAGAPGPVRVPTSVLEDVLWAAVEGHGARGGSAAGTVGNGGASGGSLRGIEAIPARRRLAATRLLRASGLAGRPLAEGWIVRPVPTRMRDSLRGVRIGRRFAGIIAAYLAQFILFVAIWQQAAARVFAGAPARGGAGSWGHTGLVALLGTWVVVQLAASAAVSSLALDVGAAVREGLMRGAMRLDRDRIRAAGVGQLLGRALDAEGLDALALGGGVEAVASVFQILLGAVVLALGATAGWSLIALAVVLAAVAAGARVQARRLSRWSHTRRTLTHDLVERMIGHRTALIQDRLPARAAADEASLRDYDSQTGALDRAEAWLGVGLPRVWLMAGLAALAPLALSSVGLVPASVAMSVGGIWLVYGALRRLGDALPLLSLAREAWRQIAPLVGESEARLAVGGDGDGDEDEDEDGRTDEDGGLIQVDHVSYRYPGRAATVLADVNLTIADGERLLIEGPSGGGKSTLAALLTGLRSPSGGVLRLRAEDQRSLGLARWRRSVAGAPQFHDNHVLGADLLFNLLMGRRWPPRVEDLEAAERVCHDLGLGPLLERMPAGLLQLVGETGWQLSHGERSRLFIARSLLQTLDARVLDESFASLDPETLDHVLTAVLARPEALIVIAHP